MGNETVQPGVETDARLWKRFRQDVKERRGRVNGVLGDEHERALRAYLDGSSGGDTADRLARIEAQQAAILEELGRDPEEVVAGVTPTDLPSGSEKEKNSRAGKDSVSKPVTTEDAITADGGDRGVVARRTDQALEELLSTHERSFKLSDLDAAIEAGAGVHSEKSIRDYRERVFERLGGRHVHPATERKRPEKRVFFTREEFLEDVVESVQDDRREEAEEDVAESQSRLSEATRENENENETASSDD